MTTPQKRPFASQTLRTNLLVLTAFFLPLASCSTTTIYEVVDGGGPGSDGDGQAGGSACVSYLACLKVIDDEAGQSAAYDEAAMLYGPSSACAQSASTMQACEEACQQALGLLNQRDMCSGSGDGGSTPDGASSGDSSSPADTGTDTGSGNHPDVVVPSCAPFGTSCATASCCEGSCLSGVCACPSGQTLCGSACVDLSSDLDNCGACGNACNPQGQGLSCGPISGVANSRCWAFPVASIADGAFPPGTDVTCDQVCTKAGLTCIPADSQNAAIYSSPATDEYGLASCSQLAPTTYEGGAFDYVVCGCYEP
jgi:hypothetical protein